MPPPPSRFSVSRGMVPLGDVCAAAVSSSEAVRALPETSSPVQPHKLDAPMEPNSSDVPSIPSVPRLKGGGESFEGRRHSLPLRRCFELEGRGGQLQCLVVSSRSVQSRILSAALFSSFTCSPVASHKVTALPAGDAAASPTTTPPRTRLTRAPPPLVSLDSVRASMKASASAMQAEQQKLRQAEEEAAAQVPSRRPTFVACLYSTEYGISIFPCFFLRN